MIVSASLFDITQIIKYDIHISIYRLPYQKFHIFRERTQHYKYDHHDLIFICNMIKMVFKYIHIHGIIRYMFRLRCLKSLVDLSGPRCQSSWANVSLSQDVCLPHVEQQICRMLIADRIEELLYDS